jgi:colicin import membrane protein
MKKEIAPYLISIALHAGIIALIIFAIPLTSYRLDNASKNTQPVVHAAIINAEKVQAQIESIQSQERQKQDEEQQKLRDLQAQAEAARQAKLAEEQQLIKMKEEHQKVQLQKQRLAEQMQAEQERLAKLKLVEQQKQEAQAKALIQKKQQEEQAKKLAAQQAKQQADLAAKEAALQKQLLQQQMDGEKQQLLQVKLQGIIDLYRARILAAIRNQWIIPEDADPNSYCVFTIELSSAGVVTKAQLIRSSGNNALDRAAEMAIHKASPLPVPQDPAAFASFQRFNLKMTPHEVS